MNRRFQSVVALLAFVALLAPLGACMVCDLEVATSSNCTLTGHTHRTDHSEGGSVAVPVSRHAAHQHSRAATSNCQNCPNEQRWTISLAQNACCHISSVPPSIVQERVTPRPLTPLSAAVFAFNTVAPLVRQVAVNSEVSPPSQSLSQQALLCVFLV
jgi:hypothetical protein